jgi:hypothetical protein
LIHSSSALTATGSLIEVFAVAGAVHTARALSWLRATLLTIGTETALKIDIGATSAIETWFAENTFFNAGRTVGSWLALEWVCGSRRAVRSSGAKLGHHSVLGWAVVSTDAVEAALFAATSLQRIEIIGAIDGSTHVWSKGTSWARSWLDASFLAIVTDWTLHSVWIRDTLNIASGSLWAFATLILTLGTFLDIKLTSLASNWSINTLWAVVTLRTDEHGGTGDESDTIISFKTVCTVVLGFCSHQRVFTVWAGSGQLGTVTAEVASGTLKTFLVVLVGTRVAVVTLLALVTSVKDTLVTIVARWARSALFNRLKTNLVGLSVGAVGAHVRVASLRWAEVASWAFQRFNRAISVVTVEAWWTPVAQGKTLDRGVATSWTVVLETSNAVVTLRADTAGGEIVGLREHGSADTVETIRAGGTSLGKTFIRAIVAFVAILARVLSNLILVLTGLALTRVA